MTDLPVDLDMLRALVEAERHRAGVPGCAVVVVHEGSVVLCEGFGYRDGEAKRPVTAQTMFPIGSATKTFTAAVLAGLAADGALDLDAPVRTYLPGFALADPVAADHLSVRDCLSHRSGLPRHDLVWQAGDGLLTRGGVVEALAHLPASRPFRSAYQYNNLLFIVAGELAARLLDATIEEVIADRILHPLAMSRTTFSLARVQGDEDHATPYLRFGDDEGITPIPFAPLDLAAAAGGLNSTAADLVPWLGALTGHDPRVHPRPLPAAVLAELRAPAIAMPTDEGAPVAAVGYGLGLMLEDHRGRRVSHHGGNIDGFSSEILTREDGIGIAVLCNLNATWLRDSLPHLILDVIDGVESPDHGTFFRDRLAARFAAAEAACRRAPASEPSDVAARPTQEYDGRYRHAGYGDCVVHRREGALVWEYGALAPGVLAHRSGEHFEIQLRLNGSEATLAAEFAVDGTGAVDALLIQMEVAVPFIRFERVR